MTDTHVIVGTDKSPTGKRVPIAEIQAAMDSLEQRGELEISVQTVGYRSAFIGAVLATVPGAIVSTRPSPSSSSHAETRGKPGQPP